MQVREPPQNPRIVLGMILLVMSFNTMDRYVVSILVDDIKADLGLSERQLGVILGPAFTVVYALAVLPLARLADLSSRRSIIAAGLFVWSLFTTATAWVATFAQLLVVRMGVGLGEASAGPTAQSLISDSVPPERRAVGLSVISIGAVLGLAAGMVGGGFVSEIWGWRNAFLFAGLPGIALALAFRLVVREPARGAVEGRDADAERREGWLADTRYLLSLASFRWLLVAHALAICCSIGKNSWEPTFIRRVYEMGAGPAGTWYFLTTPLPSACGIFLGGWLSDRWSVRTTNARMWVPAIGMLASIPFMLTFLLWDETHRIAMPGGLPALPVAFLFSIAGSVLGAFYTAPWMSAVQGLARLRMRATAAAVYSLSGSGLGSAIGPLAVGEMNERMGPLHGDEAVRFAIAWLHVTLVLCAIATAMAARSYPEELEKSHASR